MLTVGLTAEYSVLVEENNTAAAVGSGSLSVFATPALAALAEKTACLCVEEELDYGCTTVGSLLNIKHMAPTPIGMTVNCKCTLQEIDGRRLVFTATVTDGAGTVGEVYHERFIVKSASFVEKAKARAGV